MTRRLDYPAAVDALRARGRFGISLGLERIDAILERLDRPERRLRGALVAGTNGKGSVVALAAAALREAGLRVGTMPKPHLVTYRERIAIDGEPLSEAAFAAAVSRVLPAVDAVGDRLGPPTEFEVLTAAAYAELARAGVDLAVVEVGMGGRLDATNVLDPGVAVITNVALDHERHLGRTLARIGTEKAAIIKREDLAVTGAAGRGLRPILDRCAALDVPLRRAGARQAYRAELRHAGWDGLLVDAAAGGRRLEGLHVGLLGRHQAANAAVAIALLDAMRQDGERRNAPLTALDDAAIRRGFAAVRWPGRLELLRAADGPVLLDGSHNPAGARALASALGELGLRGMPLVFGATRGKRVAAMLRALAPLRPRPVFTAVADPGAMTPGELLRAWRRVGAGGRRADDPAAALALAAADRRGSEQPVVVAGSLYLVGAVRGMLLGEMGEP
jgi:dihydrofolate synthase/folylpolyglutamate synthase